MRSEAGDAIGARKDPATLEQIDEQSESAEESPSSPSVSAVSALGVRLRPAEAASEPSSGVAVEPEPRAAGVLSPARVNLRRETATEHGGPSEDRSRLASIELGAAPATPPERDEGEENRQASDRSGAPDSLDAGSGQELQQVAALASELAKLRMAVEHDREERAIELADAVDQAEIVRVVSKAKAAEARLDQAQARTVTALKQIQALDTRLRAVESARPNEQIVELRQAVERCTDEAKRHATDMRELIAALRELVASSSAALQARVDSQLQSFVDAMRPVSAATPPSGKVSLAEVSFTELRALGLSITQAERLLRFRDEGHLRSAADLATLPGFPEVLRSQLAESLE